MLTGGRSAERLYRVWSELPDFQSLKGVRFYFGDERCVPADHPESNYGVVMRSLFQRGVPAGCSIFPMDGADPDRDAAARRYDEALPEKMDVLLLGVGEDGHIASLFPGSEALHETGRRVVPVVGPKLPRERLTITPPVISRAGSIFVLAAGAAKAAVLSDLLAAPGNDALKLPARLALHATWLLDTALPEITLTESQELPCPKY
jgi:6-phosphogluconolactonase